MKKYKNKYAKEENKSKDVELENSNVFEDEKPKNNTGPDVYDVEATPTPAPIEPEEKTEVEIKAGLIVGCNRVNIREEASTTSNVVTVLEKDSVVNVNLEESTDDFYRIFLAKTDGEIISGYCMKSFVEIS